MGRLDFNISCATQKPDELKCEVNPSNGYIQN